MNKKMVILISIIGIALILLILYFNSEEPNILKVNSGPSKYPNGQLMITTFTANNGTVFVEEIFYSNGQTLLKNEKGNVSIAKSTFFEPNGDKRTSFYYDENKEGPPLLVQTIYLKDGTEEVVYNSKLGLDIRSVHNTQSFDEVLKELNFKAFSPYTK